MKNNEHVPDETSRRTVEMLAGVGLTHLDIALCLRIAPATLRKHYPDELVGGVAMANAKVLRNLFRLATGTGREAVAASIFWAKCRCGFSEFAPPRRSEGLKEFQRRQSDEAGRHAPDWATLVDDDKPN